MKDITFEYAQNLNNNEQKHDQLRERVGNCVLLFAQNTFLQLTCADIMCELYDIHYALLKGDRSEYLYNKATEYCDTVESLKKQVESDGTMESIQEFTRRVTEVYRKGGKS